LPGRKVAGLLLGGAVKGIMVWSGFGTNRHVRKTLSKIELSAHIMAPFLGWSKHEGQPGQHCASR
jgi:hypothetical protein